MSHRKPIDTARRRFLQNSLKGTASLAGATTLAAGLSGCKSKPPQSFSEIPHSLNHMHQLPSGYGAQTLMRWGDPLHNDKAFAPTSLTADDQSRRFGFNNDFIGFMPLSDNPLASAEAHLQSGNSRRGLLCVNHEYTQPHLMFPGFEDSSEARTNTTADQVAIELAASGHSVFEIELKNDEWSPVLDSPYNRRITLNTPMTITGPAAGHPRLQTSADPNGKSVLGTYGNCAGGKTPWGTILIAEEGISSAFMGRLEKMPADAQTEADNHARLGVGSYDYRNWGLHQSRFNIEREPREINRFGWMVELDPYDPQSTPRKLTSLGRFQHEGTTIVSKPGQQIAAYTGDDTEFQFFYKFISRNKYEPNNLASNRRLLEDGTLYVARLNDDGSGDWLALTYGEAGLTADNGFHSQADVLIECRRAAELLGATPMDRPEDIETNPVNDCTYLVLTKNHQRAATSTGNPSAANRAGHILELVHAGEDGNRDHTLLRFQWNIFILGGDPASSEPASRGVYGTGPDGEQVSEHGWFATPDNLAFDPRGNMWVATDGCEAFGFHDGLWAMPTSGPYRAFPKHFFGCPSGAEVCGPEFTPDGRTLFVSIQHPADSPGSSFDKPSHRWPDFDSALPPRPAVLAIRKKDGGIIGS